MDKMSKEQGGFTLVETLTLVALLGVISVSLYAVMNNISLQNDRMRVSGDLLRDAEFSREFIATAAQRAGFRSQGSAAMTRAQAVNLVSASHIQFCADNLNGTRQLTEFKLSAIENGRYRLQRRIHQNNCAVETGVVWENLTKPVFTSINFSMPNTTPPNLMLKAKFTLTRGRAGSEAEQNLTQSYLLPTYALIGLD